MSIAINTLNHIDVIIGLKQLDDNSIDLIVTSPPYNVGIEYDGYSDNMPWPEYFHWCEEWLTECYRVLKPDGRMALNHYISLGNANCRLSPIAKLDMISEKIGFKHHAIAVWQDTTISTGTAWGSFMSASSPYINSPFEGILLQYKNQWKKLRVGGINDIDKKDFIDLCMGRWKLKPETRGLTKANFSEDFAEKCIKLLSFQGDLILDPFMGSGTVALSCKKNKRNYIGFEQSKKYCDISIDRLSKCIYPDFYEFNNEIT